MPKIENLVKTQDYASLKARIQQEPAGGADATFEADTPFNFDAVRSETDEQKGKWYGVSVRLYNFIIGKATPGNDPDDPQFVGICKCPRPTLVHSDEVADCPERTPKMIDRTFGAFHPLSGDNPVRFGVFCNAFENDTTNAWNKIVDALSGDIKSAVSLGINILPELGQYATPGAVGAALSDLVRQGLTPNPDMVSGDDIICDTVNAVNWFKKTDKQTWIARKWHIFATENDQAWYLTQWFIELSSVIKIYDYAALQPSEHYNSLYALLNENNESLYADAGALMVMCGHDPAMVSLRLGIDKNNIEIALHSLKNAGKEAFDKRIQAAIAYSTGKTLMS